MKWLKDLPNDERLFFAIVVLVLGVGMFGIACITMHESLKMALRPDLIQPETCSKCHK